MSSILAPAARNSLNRVLTPLNAVTADGLSSAIPILMYQAIRFVVSGTFNAGAKVFVRGRVLDESTRFINTIYDQDRSAFLPRDGNVSQRAYVSRTGVYLVPVAGYKDIYFEVDDLTSGDVTVKAQLIATPLGAMSLPLRMNQLIWKTQGVEIDAAAQVEVADVDPCRHSWHYATFISDANHPLQVDFVHEAGTNTFAGGISQHGSHIGFETVFSETAARGFTDRVRTKGDRVRVFIKNNDAETRTYDIALFGVGP